MTDSTLDLARRCPECEELGKPYGVRPAPERRGQLHIFVCANDRCKKVGRTWIVQIRPDGTVPEPTLNREKQFPQDEGTARQRIEDARARADSVNRNSLER